MARIPTLTAALAVLPLLVAAPSAQDVAATAAREQADQRLAKALATMASQESCGFSTGLSWQQGDGQNPRGAQVLLMGAGGRVLRPGSVEEAAGAWSGGLLAIECNEDDQIVFAGRRQVARQGKGSWKLRGDRLAGGASLPFVLDPQLLFDRLRALELEVVHAEVGTWNDRPIEILTVTLEGDDAVELVWSGVLPEQGGGLNAIMVVGGGAGPVVPKPEVTIDLAFFVDPATQLVHELKVRSYSKGMGGMGRAVFVGGAGGVFKLDEEEEEEEEAEPQETEFRDGLPVRKVEDLVLQKLDITFTDHGKAILPDLDDDARRLLGLEVKPGNGTGR